MRKITAVLIGAAIIVAAAMVTAVAHHAMDRRMANCPASATCAYNDENCTRQTENSTYHSFDVCPLQEDCIEAATCPKTVGERCEQPYNEARHNMEHSRGGHHGRHGHH